MCVFLSSLSNRESKIAIEINNNNINDTRNACYYFSNPKYFPIELETLNMRRVTVCNALCVCAITVNLQIMKKRFYGFCESMYSHTQFKAHSTGLDLRASKALIHSGGCEWNITETGQQAEQNIY